CHRPATAQCERFSNFQIDACSSETDGILFDVFIHFRLAARTLVYIVEAFRILQFVRLSIFMVLIQQELADIGAVSRAVVSAKNRQSLPFLLKPAAEQRSAISATLRFAFRKSIDLLLDVAGGIHNPIEWLARPGLKIIALQNRLWFEAGFEMFV